MASAIQFSAPYSDVPALVGALAGKWCWLASHSHVLLPGTSSWHSECVFCILISNNNNIYRTFAGALYGVEAVKQQQSAGGNPLPVYLTEHLQSSARALRGLAKSRAALDLMAALPSSESQHSRLQSSSASS